MSNAHNWLLLDLALHTGQQIDDPAAVARYAHAIGRHNAATELHVATTLILHGATRPYIHPATAAKIHTATIDRSNDLEALAHEGYIESAPDPTAPDTDSFTLTARGQQAAEQLLDNRCPHPASPAG